MKIVLKGHNLLIVGAGVDGLSDAHWRAVWESMAGGSMSNRVYILVCAEEEAAMQSAFQYNHAVAAWADKYVQIISYGSTYKHLGPYLLGLADSLTLS